MKKNLIALSLLGFSIFMFSMENAQKEIKEFEPSYLSDTRFKEVKTIEDVGSLHSAYEGAVVVARAFGGLQKPVIADVTIDNTKDVVYIGQSVVLKGGSEQLKYVSKNLFTNIDDQPELFDEITGKLWHGSLAARLKHVVEEARIRMIRKYTSVLDQQISKSILADPKDFANQLTPKTHFKVAVLAYSLSLLDQEECPQIASIQSDAEDGKLLMRPFKKPHQVGRRIGGLTGLEFDDAFEGVIDKQIDNDLVWKAEALLYHHNEKVKSRGDYNSESRPLLTFVDFVALRTFFNNNK